MSPSPFTLVCFAVKEEAAPFKAAVASRPDIQILLTGMGQRNAANSLRALLRTAAVSETSRRNVESSGAHAAQKTVPLAAESINPSIHQSINPSLVLTCGFAGA